MPDLSLRMSAFSEGLKLGESSLASLEECRGVDCQFAATIHRARYVVTGAVGGRAISAWAPDMPQAASLLAQPATPTLPAVRRAAGSG